MRSAFEKSTGSQKENKWTQDQFRQTEGFNDRIIKDDDFQQNNNEDNSVNTLNNESVFSKKAQFLKALQGTFKESKNDIFGRPINDNDTQIKRAEVCLDERTGDLTKEFKEELGFISAQELLQLDYASKLKPVQDLFGVLRQKCEACNYDCIGYQPQGVLLTAPQQEMDFPTFCLNCGCPSCFHQIIKGHTQLPHSLIENLRSHNIQQSDINFNAAFMAIEILKEQDYSHNIGNLVQFLQQEGLEILSLEVRDLDIQEAIYLKIRLMKEKDEKLQSEVNKGFNKYKKSAEDGINANDVSSELFSAASRNDYASLDKIIKGYNHSLLRKKTQIQKNSKDDIQNEKLKKEKQSKVDKNNDYQDFEFQILHSTLAPRDLEASLRIKNNSEKGNQQLEDSFNKIENFEGYQNKFTVNTLIDTVRTDKEIFQILSNKYILIVIGSIVHYDIDKQLRNKIMPNFFQIKENQLLKLAYISQRKIEAMEDSLLFAPYLFRLQKSIILAEPANQFFNFNFDEAGIYDKTKAHNETNISHDKFSQSYNQPLKKQTFLTKQITNILKQNINKKLDQNNNSLKLDNNQFQESFFEKKKNQKLKLDSKWTHSNPEINKIYKNYGTMIDFFDYSGVRVQYARRNCDLGIPVALGNKLFIEPELKRIFKQVLGNVADKQKCNLFAIAKVGTPNMIFPNTLDVQIKNFQDLSQYMLISDYFFPQNSKMQISMIIIRPLIVLNKMNDLFVQILKANDFLILKRVHKTFSKSEAIYLCKLEKITKENAEFFVDQVLSGPSEIVVVSKMGAVKDAQVLCNGSQTGRRKKNQTADEGSNVRTNLDSTSSVFEIAPFSSFNEFIDLEDFFIEHSRLNKYKDQKAFDILKYQKQQEVNIIIQQFHRSTNLSAFAAPSEEEAQRLISIFTPDVTQLEDIIFMLNPLNLDKQIGAEELLVRMQYRFVSKKEVILDKIILKQFLIEKFPLDQEDVDHFISIMDGQNLIFYHLSKIAALQELKAIYESSTVTFQDHLSPFNKKNNEMFVPDDLPFLFLCLDSQQIYENAFEIIYGKDQSVYTGSDFFNKLKKQQIDQVIETVLFTTAGQSTLKVVFDQNGNFVPRKNLELNPSYTNADMSNNCKQQKYILENQLIENYQNELVSALTFSENPCVHFIVEGDKHDIFEIRFYKLNHRGDVSLNSFEIQDFVIEEDDHFEDNIQNQQQNKQARQKSVRFEDQQDVSQTKKIDPIYKQARQETLYFFEKFQAQRFYYQQVMQTIGGGLTPSLYKFRICPLDGPLLNRVYEVEEYMGKQLIQGLAEIHYHRLNQIKNSKKNAKQDWKASLLLDKQSSLPSYVVGRQMALLCQELEKVICPDQSILEGAGDIIYSQKEQVLRGNVKNIKKFHQAEILKFNFMLDKMSKRWLQYISILQTDLIEAKLKIILNSITFKYTRQQEFLCLMPNRLNPHNLRISQTIKIHEQNNDQNQEANQDQRYFKDVYSDMERSKDIDQLFDSVLHTLSQKDLDQEQNQDLKWAFSQKNDTSGKLVEYLKDKSEYTIHKQVSLSGGDVAKRPKHQLIASMIFLLDTKLRKINRQSQFFNQSNDGQQINEKEREIQYDEILDGIILGLQETYGIDEINLVLDIENLKLGNEFQFLSVLNEKLRKEQELKIFGNEQLQIFRRKRRNNPELKWDDLIEYEIRRPGKREQQNNLPSLQSFIQQAGVNKKLTVEENDQFHQLFQKTKINLGNQSLKLGEEFLKKLKYRIELGNKQIQEKISFVKMELFLYAFSEAFKLMNELRQYQIIIQNLTDQLQELENAFKDVENRQKSVKIDISRGNNIYLNSAKNILPSTNFEINVQIEKKNNQIDGLYYKMANKETELLIVFQELVNCEIYAPEHYFDGDKLLKQGMFAQKSTDQVLVPLKTFWLPVINVEEDFVDPNSEDAIKYRIYQPIPQNNDVGQFLAPSLKKFVENIQKDQLDQTQKSQAQSIYQKSNRSLAKKESDRSLKSKFQESQKQVENQDFENKKLHGVNNLRQYKQVEFPQNIEFKKIKYPTDDHEAQILNEIKQEIQTKTAYQNPTEQESKRLKNLFYEKSQKEEDYQKDIENGFMPKSKIQDLIDDPFLHLRNKEKADQLIDKGINQFELMEKSSLQNGLDKMQSQKLAIAILKKMKQKNIECDEFNDLNFTTSFKIYAQSQQNSQELIDKNHLKHFIKSVANL